MESVAGKVAGDLLVINPTSFDRNDLAFWSGRLAPSQRLQAADGTALPTQITHEGTWIAVGEQERFGVSSLSMSAGDAPIPDTGLVVTPTLLENTYLRVELDQAGDITRIYDKTCGRDVLPADAVANQFQAFEDRPLKYDAWDIDVFFEDKIWTADPATSVEVVEAGRAQGHPQDQPAYLAQ